MANGLVEETLKRQVSENSNKNGRAPRKRRKLSQCKKEIEVGLFLGIEKLQAASDSINQRFADLKAILRTVSRPNLNKKIKQSF